MYKECPGCRGCEKDNVNYITAIRSVRWTESYTDATKVFPSVPSTDSSTDGPTVVPSVSCIDSYTDAPTVVS